MYVALQDLEPFCDLLPLNEITKQFGLSHYGSVLGTVAKFDRQINENSHLAGLINKAEDIISK